MGKKIWLSSMRPGNFGSEKIGIVSPSVRPSLHVKLVDEKCHTY